MTTEIWIPVFATLLGLVLGSFMNVCIYRIPRKESIVYPSSHCPECGTPIRFRDNIPLLSFLLLGGKCRFCKKSIPLQYPVVEGISGLLSLALVLKTGLTLSYPFLLLFVLSLVTISIIDLQQMIIPDVITIPGMLVGLGVSLFPFSPPWYESLIGLLAGGGGLLLVALAYYWISGKEGMGGGDVKLLAMIGAWMGWKALPLVLLLSSLSGTLVGALFLLIQGKGFRLRIPFGPFLSMGGVAALFFGSELMEWYFTWFI